MKSEELRALIFRQLNTHRVDTGTAGNLELIIAAAINVAVAYAEEQIPAPLAGEFGPLYGVREALAALLDAGSSEAAMAGYTYDPWRELLAQPGGRAFPLTGRTVFGIYEHLRDAGYDDQGIRCAVERILGKPATPNQQPLRSALCSISAICETLEDARRVARRALDEDEK